MTKDERDRRSTRRPILMGEAERLASGVEDPCPIPLTRSLLDAASRRQRSPDHLLSITPKCHSDAGMKIWYSRQDGCAVLACGACGAGVVRLQLANEAPS